MSDMTPWAFESEDAVWVCSGHVTFAELERRIAESMQVTVATLRSWHDMTDLDDSDIEHRWGVVTEDPDLWVEWGDVIESTSGAVPITMLTW